MTISYSHGDVVEFEKTSVALGTFDGLHVAHMKIIDTAARFAADNNIKCGAMMFDKIPACIISGGQIPQLMSVSNRIKLLPKLDFVYTESFDSGFAEKSPMEFVSYLKNTLKAVAVSVGYNYRFGKGASGDTELLKELCEKEGITVFVTEKEELYGEVISSTRVRGLISEGKVKEAALLLGRCFFISGTVIEGLQNGRKMGIPTANIIPEDGMIIPKNGVYAGFCSIGSKKYASVINVGNNPTFEGCAVTVECHILDFNGDIYGKEITVYFAEYIRDEIKFQSADDLKARIDKDIKFAKKELINYE